MRTFIADIFPKIQRFSKKLDQLSNLINHHWVSLNDITNSKTVFIFRVNNQILISENGVVEKGSWEYLGNDSILLERNHKTYLLKQAFVDEDVLALKLDGSSGFVVFINETKHDNEINTIDDVVKYLTNKYKEKENKTVFTRKEKKTSKDVEQKEIETPTYSENSPVDTYDLFNGKHFTITIYFSDGLTGNISLGGKSKKYFLQYGLNGIQYFDTKEQCIDFLYKRVISSAKRNSN